jgi:hypothetical protein
VSRGQYPQRLRTPPLAPRVHKPHKSARVAPPPIDLVVQDAHHAHSSSSGGGVQPVPEATNYAFTFRNAWDQDATVTLPTNVSEGSMIVLSTVSRTDVFVGISDTLGLTWTQRGSTITGVQDVAFARVFTAVVGEGQGGACTITYNATPSGDFSDHTTLIAVEYPNADFHDVEINEYRATSYTSPATSAMVGDGGMGVAFVHHNGGGAASLTSPAETAENNTDMDMAFGDTVLDDTDTFAPQASEDNAFWSSFLIAVALKPSAVGGSETSDIPLTQVHNLTVQDSAHALVSDNIDLTLGGTNLVVQDSTHALTSDNITLVQIGQGIWEEVSPVTGLDPDDPTPGANFGYQGLAMNSQGHVYAHLDHTGLYRSTDHGDNWTKYNTDAELDSGSAWTLEVDPFDDDIMWATAGYGGGGPLKSTDGGLTWTKISVGAPTVSDDVYKIALDPYLQDHVLITWHSLWSGGADSGISESFNGGSSWTNHTPPGTTWDTGHAIFFGDDSDTWFVATQTDGLWRTVDSGDNWVREVTESMTHGACDCITKADTSWIYTAEHHIYRSTDNGANWTDITGSLSTGVYYSATATDGINLFTAGSYPITPNYGSTGAWYTKPIASGSWTEMTDSPDPVLDSNANGPRMVVNGGGYVFTANYMGGIWRLESTTDILTVQSATHTLTSDNITLSTAIDLTVADGTHAHTADNIVLTQVHSLVVQDGAHAHAADNITLTQVHNLVISDGAHGHIARPLTAAISLPGTSGNNVSITDAPPLDIIGDITLVGCIAPDNWASGADQAIVAKYNTSSGNHRSYRFVLTSTGSLRIWWSTNGTDFFSLTSTVNLPNQSNGTFRWVAITLDVDNGASNPSARFWYSSDGSSWTQLGTTVNGTGGVTSLFSGPANLEIGSINAGGSERFAGRVKHISVRDGIGASGVVGGTEVFKFDATTDLVNVSSSATSFTASTGQTVTVNRSGSPSTNLIPHTTNLTLTQVHNLVVADSTHVHLAKPLTAAVDFPGEAGNYLTAPDHNDLDIIGDITFVAKIAPSDWTPDAENSIVAKFNPTGNQRSYRFELIQFGQLFLGWSTSGSNAVFAGSTSTLNFANDEPRWVAATLDVDNGSTQNVTRFWTSTDGSNWTQLGNAVTQAGVTSIHSGTALLEIGALAVGTLHDFDGRIMHVSIRNGIGVGGTVGGTEVFRFDAPTDLVGIAPSATSFAAFTGQTLTVNRSGSPSTTIIPSTTTLTLTQVHNLVVQDGSHAHSSSSGIPADTTSDDFNRTNTTSIVGPDWQTIADSTWQKVGIIDNEAANTADFFQVLAVRTTPTDTTDQFVEVDVWQADGEPVLVLCADPAQQGTTYQTGYQLRVYYWQNQWDLFKNSTDVATFTGTGAGGSTWTRLRLEREGNVITAYQDGVEIGNWTDSSSQLTAKYYGIGGSNNSGNVRFDNFEGGELGAGKSPDITLTQVHNLTVQDGSHAHSADNITLQVSGIDLVVADGTHAHLADNIVLTQVHELVVQDAAHAHEAETPTLTQTHVLVVADGAHVHTSDNIVLTQVHTLVVNDATHAHTADNLGLTQAHSITVADAHHEHDVGQSGGAPSMTALGSALEWQTTQGQWLRAAQLDSTHWIAVFGITGNQQAQVFAVDGSGNMSAIGSPFTYDSNAAADGYPDVAVYDSDTAVVVYKGATNDGTARALSINTGTWAVTSGGSAATFESDSITSYEVKKVPGLDAFVVAARATTGNDGFAYALTFDPGTGALALGGTALEFDIANCFCPTIDNINGDATRWLVCYEFAGADGNAVVLTLNTSTWAFTTTSSLEFDTNEARFIETVPLDANHFLLTWTDVTAGISEAQVLEVNLSTWAITAVGSPITLDAATHTVTGERHSSLVVLDHPTGKYVVTRAYRSLADGFIKADMLSVNDSTWAVTLDAELGSVSPATGKDQFIQKVSPTRAIIWWTDTASTDGFVQSFDISAGGGGDLVLTQVHNITVADGAHTHSVDNVVLTQVHSLEVQDSTHALVSDSVVLNVEGDLIVHEGAHAVTSDNILLTQVHQLVVQDSSHTLASDNLTITVDAITLVVNDGTHAHSADNIVLTQVHALTVADAAHAHAADALTLTQEHNLTISESSHTVASDNLVLTQIHYLQVNDSTNAVTSDNINLTQTHALSVDEARSAHAADNIQLTQAHSLTVQDGHHALVSDNITIVVGGITLTVADSTSAHSADNVTLTQVHQLVVQDAHHTLTTPNLELTQIHSLSVADASNAITSDNVQLTQAHNLSVQEGIHNHTADPLALTQVHNLSISESRHEFTSDNITLNVVYDLVVQDGFHAVTSDNVNLAEYSQLVIGPSTHAHTADNVTLTQIHNLAVQNARHVHRADHITLGEIGEGIKVLKFVSTNDVVGEDIAVIGTNGSVPSQHRGIGLVTVSPSPTIGSKQT